MERTWGLRDVEIAALLRPWRRVIESLLVLALGLNLWSLAQGLRPAKAEVSPIPGPISTKLQSTNFQRAMGIFGTFVPPTSAAPVASSGDIKLLGVVVAEDPKASLAILEFGGKDLTLPVGAALPDGEILKSVGPSSVMLNQGGQERTLAWEMQYAPANASFDTLSYDQVESGAPNQTVSRAVVEADPPLPAADQLIVLRQAALQVIAKRVHVPPPTPP